MCFVRGLASVPDSSPPMTGASVLNIVCLPGSHPSVGRDLYVNGSGSAHGPRNRPLIGHAPPSVGRSRLGQLHGGTGQRDEITTGRGAEPGTTTAVAACAEDEKAGDSRRGRRRDDSARQTCPVPVFTSVPSATGRNRPDRSSAGESVPRKGAPVRAGTRG